MPLRERQPKGTDSGDCIFYQALLLMNNYRDALKDQCEGGAHNACNLKLPRNPKTAAIPVDFHNLKSYDGHLLMQGMVQGEIRCIPNKTEKYISFSLGKLKFIDSLKFNDKQLRCLGAAHQKI